MIEAVLKALLHFLGERSLWDEKYLIKFLHRNLKFFSQKQIEMVLVATAKSRGWTHRIGIYLARFLEKSNIEFQLSDSQILHELIYPKREGCAPENKVDDFVFLHPYLSPDLQKELVAAVKEKLAIANPESVLLWFQAKCEGALPSEEEMPENLLAVFEKQFARISAIQFQPDGEVILRHSLNVNIPYWFGALVYSDSRGLGIETTKRLLADSNLPGVFRWLLDPEGFDYQTFDCMWVFFFKNDALFGKIGAMKIPQLQRVFHEKLKEDYSSELAKVYFKHFADKSE
ncbi:MAG: hypothetical protein IPM82_14325 [Saprospiraceae bacterium]|nr:hypothetical protein [Saprospiraceae bacterium]